MITRKFSLFMFIGVLALCLFSARVSAFEYPLGDLGLPHDYNQTLRDFTSEVPNLGLFVEQLPTSWNWMSQGMVTPAKDQGSCGSCWAFAAVGTLESKILIASGGTWDLSEQQQVSCNTSQYGCDGGYLSALQYWEPNGPMQESCTGYSSYDGSSVACSTISSCPVLGTRTTGYYTVTMTVDSVKTSLYNDGPGSFRFNVYSDFYEHWYYGTSGQVYKQQSGSYRGGHAVLLIGWDDSKQAWLLKNSWGETGGPQGNGTFWMAYSGHSNDLDFGMANILITGPPTSVPVLNSPTAIAIGSTSATIGATITYNGGSTVTASGVAYGTSANPDISGTKVTSSATSGAFTVNVTGLTSNTLYHFRGYATNTAGTGYTADSTFTTVANAPTATGATSITTSGFTANWTAPSGTATISGYRLDVATDSGFTSLVSGYNNLSVSGTSQAVSGLNPGTPYYYRVRAVNAGGTSANSNTIHPMAAFISGPSSTSTKSGPITYTVTYSSADTITLAAGNVSVNKTGTANGNVGVSGTGNTRTVTVSAITGDGTLGISIVAGTASDSAGNTTPAAGPSTTFTVDNTAPTISIGSPSATSTRSGPVTYTVTYGEADTISPAAGNITLNKTGTASGSVAVSGSGNTRTVTISSITGDGTLGISITAGTASDNAGNSAPSAGPSTTFEVDNTAPRGSISAPSSTAVTKSGPVTYTMTYSGADTITLAAGNVTLNKTGTASGSIAVTGSGNTSRTVTISTISGDGTLGIGIAAGTATDQAGNSAPAAGPSATFDVDNTAPTISISAPSATSTRSCAVAYGVTYSGADTVSLEAKNITLNKTSTANGSIAVTGSGRTYKVTIDGISGDGTLGIGIAAGTAIDQAGNTAPGAGPSATFIVDHTLPAPCKDISPLLLLLSD